MTFRFGRRERHRELGLCSFEVKLTAVGEEPVNLYFCSTSAPLAPCRRVLAQDVKVAAVVKPQAGTRHVRNTAFVGPDVAGLKQNLGGTR